MLQSILFYSFIELNLFIGADPKHHIQDDLIKSLVHGRIKGHCHRNTGGKTLANRYDSSFFRKEVSGVEQQKYIYTYKSSFIGANKNVYSTFHCQIDIL